ncbi:hypothetical protein OEZ86_007968 [Tetradesmus obliquus]|nr:hypothetical protein OEZ86_007968 [Tetradesmus obliquus]
MNDRKFVDWPLTEEERQLALRENLNVAEHEAYARQRFQDTFKEVCELAEQKGLLFKPAAATSPANPTAGLADRQCADYVKSVIARTPVSQQNLQLVQCEVRAYLSMQQRELQMQVQSEVADRMGGKKPGPAKQQQQRAHAAVPPPLQRAGGSAQAASTCGQAASPVTPGGVDHAAEQAEPLATLTADDLDVQINLSLPTGHGKTTLLRALGIKPGLLAGAVLPHYKEPDRLRAQPDHEGPGRATGLPHLRLQGGRGAQGDQHRGRRHQAHHRPHRTGAAPASHSTGQGTDEGDTAVQGTGSSSCSAAQELHFCRMQPAADEWRSMAPPQKASWEATEMLAAPEPPYKTDGKVYYRLGRHHRSSADPGDDTDRKRGLRFWHINFWLRKPQFNFWRRTQEIKLRMVCNEVTCWLGQSPASWNRRPTLLLAGTWNRHHRLSRPAPHSWMHTHQKGATWRSKIDCRSGFFNIPLSEESKQYTAFWWDGIQPDQAKVAAMQALPTPTSADQTTPPRASLPC